MHGKQGSILVCLDSLPPGVSRKGLKDLMQQAVDSSRLVCGLAGRLRLTSNVLHCTILRISNPDNGATTYRGLATIAPARCALAAIAALNRMEVNGFRLHARRFRHHGLGEAETSLGDVLPAETDGAPPARLVLELVQSTSPLPLPTTVVIPATASPLPPPTVAVIPAAAARPTGYNDPDAALPARPNSRPPASDYPLFAH